MVRMNTYDTTEYVALTSATIGRLEHIDEACSPPGRYPAPLLERGSGQ
jgi:hypothetical protein